MAGAQSRIDVLVYAGAFLFEHPAFGKAAARVLDNGGSVRMLLGDPEGPQEKPVSRATRAPDFHSSW